jgi:Flp pilus assembly pilin Flp
MTITPATRRKCGLRRAEDGATAVEAALVLSIFVGVVLTIIDFAQEFFIWNKLQDVVGRASRYVMVQTSIPDPPPGSASANCQPPAGSAASCAIGALTTRLPGASSSCDGRTYTRSILRRRHLHGQQLQPLRPIWVQVCGYLHLGGPNHRSDRPSARLKAA